MKVEWTEELRVLRAMGRVGGKKGGLVTSERYGREYYQKIGSKGGRKNAEKGHQYFVELGRKGGARIRELAARGKAQEAFERDMEDPQFETKKED